MSNPELPCHLVLSKVLLYADFTSKLHELIIGGGNSIRRLLWTSSADLTTITTSSEVFDLRYVSSFPPTLDTQYSFKHLPCTYCTRHIPVPLT